MPEKKEASSKQPAQSQTDYWRVLEDIPIKEQRTSEHQLNFSSHEKCDNKPCSLTAILK